MGDQYSYIRPFGCTDVGRVRKHNEDAIGLSPSVACFVVADGMGGEDAGEIASAQVVTSLKDELERERDTPGVDNLDRKRQLIGRALVKANHAIRTYVARQGLHQSGSTVVVLAFDAGQPQVALTANVGDSRIYRLRGDALTQLTADHSVAAAAGVTDENEIPAMFRGMVTRAIGIKEMVEPEFKLIDVAPGDLYLLCSDGLSGMVPDRKMAKRLRAFSPHDPKGKHGLESVAKQLVDDANAAGGKDNISLVLVHVGESGSPPGEPALLTKVSLPVEAGPPPVDLLTDEDPLGFDTLASQSPTQATRRVERPSPVGATTVKNVEVDLPVASVTAASGREPLMSKERWVLVLLGLVLMGFLAYMVYIGFMAETPEIDTGAFPKAPDELDLLNSLGPDETSAVSVAVPLIDLRDGQAIRDARETGQWGLIKDAVLAGAMLPEGERMLQAERGMALWSTMRQHPDKGYAAYVDLHRALVASGAEDLLNAAYFIQDAPADVRQRADVLCRFAARFDRQVAPMLDEAAMRISNLNKLFSIRGRPLPVHLGKVVELSDDQLNMDALRETIPAVKTLRDSLETLAEDMRGIGSTPQQLARVDLAAFDAFAGASVDWVNGLNRVLDEQPIRDLESDIATLSPGIQAVGRELILAIQDAQTELKVARGAASGALSLADLERLLPIYLEFSGSVYAYNQWLDQVVPSTDR